MFKRGKVSLKSKMSPTSLECGAAALKGRHAAKPPFKMSSSWAAAAPVTLFRDAWLAAFPMGRMAVYEISARPQNTCDVIRLQEGANSMSWKLQPKCSQSLALSPIDFNAKISTLLFLLHP